MEHSLISWIQIPVIDFNRGVKFYKHVFDADFLFEELNGIPHAIFKKNANGRSVINGALVKFADVEKLGPGPRLFFEATGKFEEIIERIEAYGGEVVVQKTLIKHPVDGTTNRIPKTYIDDKEGYYAHFYDSEGNRFGLYGAS
jgi:predicted enzyme related to lactoylglutathione lyase